MAGGRHHYLPQFYLNHFSDPTSAGRLWQYDKKGGAPIISSIRKLGFERNYNTIEKADGSKDTETLEHEFCKVEGAAAPVIARLNRQERISPEEMEKFICFLAAMLARVPYHKESAARVMEGLVQKHAEMMAGNPHFFRLQFEHFQERTGNFSDTDPEEVRQVLLGKTSAKIKADRKAAYLLGLSTMMQVGIECLPKMNWTFAVASKERPFLTSDNPACYIVPPSPDRFSLRGLGNPKVQVTFPVGPMVMALGAYEIPFQGDFTPVPPSIVEGFNRRVVHSSHRFIFANRNDETDRLFIAQHAREATFPKVF